MTNDRGETPQMMSFAMSLLRSFDMGNSMP
jgi:hypothetical protein